MLYLSPFFLYFCIISRISISYLRETRESKYMHVNSNERALKEIKQQQTFAGSDATNIDCPPFVRLRSTLFSLLLFRVTPLTFRSRIDLRACSRVRHATRNATTDPATDSDQATRRSSILSRTRVSKRRYEEARREIRRQHGKGDSRVRYNHPYMGLNYIQICKYFWRNGDKRCHGPSTSLDSDRIERFVFTHISFTTLSFLLLFNVLPTCSTFLRSRFLRFHRFAILRITCFERKKKLPPRCVSYRLFLFLVHLAFTRIVSLRPAFLVTAFHARQNHEVNVTFN